MRIIVIDLSDAGVYSGRLIKETSLRVRKRRSDSVKQKQSDGDIGETTGEMAAMRLRRNVAA